MTPLQVAEAQLERYRDFIEYLFEHSVHCDQIPLSEAWEEFEQYENKQKS